MMRLSLVPSGTDIQFILRRKIFFVFSLVLVLTSIMLFSVHGMNYGIDFKGGILIDVQTSGPADIADLRNTLGNLGLGDVALQEFGAENDVLIRVPRQPGGDETQNAAVDLIRQTLGDTVAEYRRIEVVGPTVSDELFWDGVMAVGLALIAMLIYIWFRFEWQFGLGAVLALAHDIFATIGIFSILQLEFNLSTVAAVLTIAGYSINDTVVVFDRVRENLRKYKSMPLPQLLNQSINETLSRTVMTSLTTLLALLALYFLGGEVIQGFSFAMIWGVVVGTYSSICVAVPVLLYLKLPRRGGESKATSVETAG